MVQRYFCFLSFFTPTQRETIRFIKRFDSTVFYLFSPKNKTCSTTNTTTKKLEKYWVLCLIQFCKLHSTRNCDKSERRFSMYKFCVNAISQESKYVCLVMFAPLNFILSRWYFSSFCFRKHFYWVYLNVTTE